MSPAVHLGRDPKTVLAEAAGELAFDAAARELIDSMAPGWRNAKHRAQWRMTLLGKMVAKDGSTKKTRYDYCAAIRTNRCPSSPPRTRCACSSRCGRRDRDSKSPPRPLRARAFLRPVLRRRVALPKRAILAF